MAKLGEMLVASGKLGQRDLDRALVAQSEMGGLLGQVLVRLGLVSEADLMIALSQQLDMPMLIVDQVPESAVDVSGLSWDFLRANHILPLALDESSGVLDVAMSVPNDPFLIKGVSLASGYLIRSVLATESEISSQLQRLFASAGRAEDSTELSADAMPDDEFVEHLRDLATEAPVIRLVNKLVFDAIDLRASDIHVEPSEADTQIRYRVDGVLQAGEFPPANLGAAIISRIKLLAHLNIAERRLPQDGRIRLRVKGHEVDLRVSTVPTVHGESVVIRILDRSSVRFSLEGMGFSEEHLAQFKSLLHRPHGILLVTGPTGSGKTTTLYAGLSELDSARQKNSHG